MLVTTTKAYGFTYWKLATILLKIRYKSNRMADFPLQICGLSTSIASVAITPLLGATVNNLAKK